MMIAFDRSLPDMNQLEALMRNSVAESAEELAISAIPQGCSVVSAYDNGELVGLACLNEAATEQQGKLQVVVLPAYRERNIDGTMRKLLYAKRTLQEFGIRCNIK